MRFASMIAASFLFSSLAHAGVNCHLTVPSDAANPNLFDRTILTVSLPEADGPETTIFAFVKADRSVSTMTRDEFYAQKDLSAFSGQTYFTFQHARPTDYLISFGKVDGTPEENGLRGISYTVGGLGQYGIQLFADGERIVATCGQE